MSLDKSIAHGKERRKPYRGSKAFDPSCRNHGGCPWCEENRKHKFRYGYDEMQKTAELDAWYAESLND